MESSTNIKIACIYLCLATLLSSLLVQLAHAQDFAPPVNCQPHLDYVETDPTRHRYFPYITKIHRCRGADHKPSEKKCIPVPNTDKRVQVKTIDMLTGNSVTMTMVNHTACQSVCKYTKADCINNQVYDEKGCICKCQLKQPPLPCAPPNIWSTKTCACACPATVKQRGCPTNRMQFSQEECKCQCKERFYKKCAREKRVLDESTCYCADPVVITEVIEASSNTQLMESKIKISTLVIAIVFEAVCFIAGYFLYAHFRKERKLNNQSPVRQTKGVVRQLSKTWNQVCSRPRRYSVKKNSPTRNDDDYTDEASDILGDQSQDSFFPEHTFKGHEAGHDPLSPRDRGDLSPKEIQDLSPLDRIRVESLTKTSSKDKDHLLSPLDRVRIESKGSKDLSPLDRIRVESLGSGSQGPVVYYEHSPHHSDIEEDISGPPSYVGCSPPSLGSLDDSRHNHPMNDLEYMTHGNNRGPAPEYPGFPDSCASSALVAPPDSYVNNLYDLDADIRDLRDTARRRREREQLYSRDNNNYQGDHHYGGDHRLRNPYGDEDIDGSSYFEDVQSVV